MNWIRIEVSNQKFFWIFLDHLLVPSEFLRFKLSRRSKLHHLSVIHHQYLIRISQSWQSMRYGQHCAFFELLSDDFLNNGIVLDIDVRSCFVNKNDFAMFEKCPTNTEKLFLSSWQTLVWNRGFKSPFLHDGLIKITFLQDLVQLFIWIHFCDVKILLERSFDESGFLINHGDPISQIFHKVILNSSPINEQISTWYLGNSQ